jgi:hypothetical protein
VDEVRAMAVNEIWKARGTTKSGKRDDFFVREISFLEEFVKRGEHSEIAATGTPRRMVSGNRFLG